jgi:hypothetical protein
VQGSELTGAGVFSGNDAGRAAGSAGACAESDSGKANKPPMAKTIHRIMTTSLDGRYPFRRQKYH